MSATTTIARLRKEVQALRAENPEVAAIYSENELLKRAVEMYEAHERKLAAAIENVLRSGRRGEPSAGELVHGGESARYGGRSSFGAVVLRATASCLGRSRR